MATTAVAASGLSMPTRNSRQNPGSPGSTCRATSSSKSDACSIANLPPLPLRLLSRRRRSSEQELRGGACS
uniref:Membrane protein n=1 Tax=Arundo donax TaxID=35708 RepID=A0A0A9C4D7_ARUDO